MADADINTIAVLKRKYIALQEDFASAVQLLDRFRSLPQSQAFQVIEYLRTGEDVASTLDFARNLDTSLATEQLESGVPSRSVTAPPSLLARL